LTYILPYNIWCTRVCVRMCLCVVCTRERKRERERELCVCICVCVCALDYNNMWVLSIYARACVYKRIFIRFQNSACPRDIYIYKVPLFILYEDQCSSQWHAHLKGGLSEGILPIYLLRPEHIWEHRKNVVLCVYTNIIHSLQTI